MLVGKPAKPMQKRKNSTSGAFSAPDGFFFVLHGFGQHPGHEDAGLPTRMLTHTEVRCRRTFVLFSRNDIPWYFGVKSCFFENERDAP